MAEQTFQNYETSSQSGREHAVELPDIPNRQPLGIVGSTLYNPFPAAPQLHHSTEYGVSMHPLNTIPPQPLISPGTLGHSPQNRTHFQSHNTQLPDHASPQLDQLALQLYMDGNGGARECEQIVEEVPEFQPVPHLGPLNDQVYHTNPYLHPDNEISTLDWNYPSDAFDMAVLPDNSLQMNPITNDSSNLYGPIPNIWSIQPPPNAIDPSSFHESHPQQAFFDLNVGSSQNSLENYSAPFSLPFTEVIPSGSSSYDAHRNRPEFHDQAVQSDSLGLSQCYDIDEPTANQDTTMSIYPLDIDANLSTACVVDVVQHVPNQSTTVVPCQHNSTSEDYARGASWPLHVPLSVTARPSASKANLLDPTITPALPQSCNPLGTINRKRGRTPEAFLQQQTSMASAVANPPGSMEPALEICQYTGPGLNCEQSPKRKRTRVVTTKVKAACFWCKAKQRRCDPVDNGPCRQCQAIVSRLYGQQFSLPRFTCSIRTKLSELEILPKPKDGHLAVKHITINRETAEPLLDLLDGFEPGLPRQKLPESFFLFVPYSYCQSMIRYKRVLLYYAPRFKEYISMLEEEHGLILYNILRQVDNLNMNEHKRWSLIVLGFVYDGIKSFRFCDTADQTAVDHLQSALEHRLVVLIGDMFSAGTVTKRSRREQLDKVADELSWISREVHFLPPDYRRYRQRWRSLIHITQSKEVSVCTQWTSVCPQWPPAPGVEPTSPSCAETTGKCFCALIFYCLPVHVSKLFVSNLEAFARDLHNTSGIFREINPPLLSIFRAQRPSRQKIFDTVVTEIYKLVVSFSFEMYFETMADEMVSNDWDVSFDQKYPGRLADRFVISLMSQIYRVATVLMVVAIKDLGDPLVCATSVMLWMNTSEAGKKAHNIIRDEFREFLQIVKDDMPTFVRTSDSSPWD